jgi:hypothetical protein
MIAWQPMGTAPRSRAVLLLFTSGDFKCFRVGRLVNGAWVLVVRVHCVFGPVGWRELRAGFSA